MPFATPYLPPNPKDSGTGQGFLTDEQERALARIWYGYKQEQAVQDYAQGYRHLMNMDPNDAQWMQYNYDHPANGADKDWQDSVANEGLHPPAGGPYEFPQPHATIKKDPKTGGKLYGETGPDGFDPMVPLPNIPTDPPWWADPRVMHASYDGVTPASYTPHKPLLSTAQAAAFMNLMLVQGHNGDTVGRGQVVPHPAPTKTGPDRAEL